MTIPEALKELYVALGGDADDVANMSTNPELIAKIATIAGGGSGLPEVTAEDNGDVLTVVEGAWGKAEPSGGSVLVVDGTINPNAGVATLSKSGREIATAGVPVIVKADNGSGYVYFHLSNADALKSQFISVVRGWSSPGTTYYYFEIDNTETSAGRTYQYKQTTIND